MRRLAWRLVPCHRRIFLPARGFIPHLPRYIPRWSLIPFRSTTSSSDGYPDFVYQPIEDVERLERYQPGGYHPIHIGDELNNRYRVVHKLGHGAYSTIWLSRDEQHGAYVAIKVGTGDASPCEADILRRITEGTHSGNPGLSMIPKVRERFEIPGPNGHHRCYVTVPAQSSVSAALFCRHFQVETARALAAQLVLAVSCLHFQGVVHGGKLRRSLLPLHPSGRTYIMRIIANPCSRHSPRQRFNPFFSQPGRTLNRAILRKVWQA